ncbi:Hypothetical predicted protein, partial [Mytilus galloprovincialis]
MKEVFRDFHTDNTNIHFNILVPFGTIVQNKNGDFRCQINGTAAIGTVNNKTNLCNINIQNLYADNYTFEITYEDVVIASANIEFYNCQHIRKCKICIRARCYWDPMTLSCGGTESYSTVYISPSSGPINGGTLLTVFTNREINDDDIIIINIDEDNCTVNNITEDNCSLSCITGNVSKSTNGTIHVSVNNSLISLGNDTSFTYKDPRIDDFNPRKGIITGKTTITIRGKNLAFKGRDRYKIKLCDNNDNVTCIECRLFEK